MDRYAIVSLATWVVTNVAQWDGVTSWEPGDGFEAIPTDDAEVGWSYSPETGLFSPPASGE